MDPFQIRRCSSYVESSGRIRTPPNDIASSSTALRSSSTPLAIALTRTPELFEGPQCLTKCGTCLPPVRDHPVPTLTIALGPRPRFALAIRVAPTPAAGPSASSQAGAGPLGPL